MPMSKLGLLGFDDSFGNSLIPIQQRKPQTKQCLIPSGNIPNAKPYEIKRQLQA
jgi:hypothetical protein